MPPFLTGSASGSALLYVRVCVIGNVHYWFSGMVDGEILWRRSSLRDGPDRSPNQNLASPSFQIVLLPRCIKDFTMAQATAAMALTGRDYTWDSWQVLHLDQRYYIAARTAVMSLTGRNSTLLEITSPFLPNLLQTLEKKAVFAHKIWKLRTGEIHQKRTLNNCPNAIHSKK